MRHDKHNLSLTITWVRQLAAQFKLTADDDAARLHDRVWSGHLTRVLSIVPLLHVTHQQIVSVAVTLNRHSLLVGVDAPVG